MRCPTCSLVSAYFFFPTHKPLSFKGKMSSSGKSWAEGVASLVARWAPSTAVCSRDWGSLSPSNVTLLCWPHGWRLSWLLNTSSQTEEGGRKSFGTPVKSWLRQWVLSCPNLAFHTSLSFPPPKQFIFLTPRRELMELFLRDHQKHGRNSLFSMICFCGVFFFTLPPPFTSLTSSYFVKLEIQPLYMLIPCYRASLLSKRRYRFVSAWGSTAQSRLSLLENHHNKALHKFL